MSYNSVVNALGPVAYWRLGESSGSTFSDEISTNDLFLGGGTPSYSQASLVKSDSTNTCIGFDGATYLYANDANIFSINNTGKLAFVFFINADSLAAWQGVLAKGFSFNYEWSVHIKDSVLKASITDPIGYLLRQEKATISANTTHHVVINFTGYTDSDEIEIYVDGVKSNSFDVGKDASATGYSNGNRRVDVGYGHIGLADRYFDGDLDEIAVFDAALTAQNVADLYAAATGIVAVQSSQTATVAATKTGTNTASATVAAVQSSQTASVTASTTDPDDYCIAIQGEQRAVAVANTIGENNFNYFATKGFTTSAGSTPAGEEIPPTLRNPGNFSKALNVDDFGVVRPSFGEITISNLDGTHDDLLTKKIQGQPATLYYHPEQEIFVLVVENAP